MSTRSWSPVPALIALTLAVVPDFAHGQGVPGITIDRAEFIVSTSSPNGIRTSRATNRVPLDPYSCYAWRLHFSQNTIGELAWREVFRLPGAPAMWSGADTAHLSPDRRILITEKRATPTNGWLSHEWCVAPGDPTGKHEISVYVQRQKVRSFDFEVVPVPRPVDTAVVAVAPPVRAPAPVSTSTDTLTFAAVSAGGIHTCGVTTAGAAYCWGWNTRGQLGDGTSGNEQSRPVRVTGGVSFTAVSAGDRYTCALTAAGAAHCWGLNGWGQLGDGTTTDRSSPVAVAGGQSFTAISPGFRQTCAVTAAGAAYCWGLNGSGQLGDGTTTDRSSPVSVAGGLRFTAISAGEFHSCGLTAAGAAYCWGANGDGQLGDGSTTSRPSPARVAGDVTFAAVSAGGFHTCAHTRGGAVYCWGANADGQLGDGKTTSRSKAARVAGDSTFTMVSAGLSHTCGVVKGGAAYCWGANGDGQLGDGSTTSRSRPVRVAGNVTFAAVQAGGSGQAMANHTCGLTGAGALYCWGQNARCQLGDGTTTDRNSPVAVVQSGARASAAIDEDAAAIATMKSDLRNLIVAEEVFFADSVKYTSKVGPGGVDLHLSEGNVLLSLQLTTDGWAATLGRANTQNVCAIFVGSTPLPPATEEAVPACR